MPLLEIHLKENTLLFKYYPANQLAKFCPSRSICLWSTGFIPWTTQCLHDVTPIDAQYNLAIHNSYSCTKIKLVLCSITNIGLSSLIIMNIIKLSIINFSHSCGAILGMCQPPMLQDLSTIIPMHKKGKYKFYRYHRFQTTDQYASQVVWRRLYYII